MKYRFVQILPMVCFLLVGSVVADSPETKVEQRGTYIQSLRELFGNSIKKIIPESQKSQQEGIAKDESNNKGPDIYLVELPAVSDSATKRRQLFAQGLTTILEKNFDNHSIGKIEQIKEAIVNPEIYVQSFSYIKKKDESADKLDLFLRMNFDAKAISKLLETVSSGPKIRNRPLTLVWLVSDYQKGEILDGGSSHDQLADTLKSKAGALGLGVVLPSLDLEDVANIKSYDICSLNDGKIREASLRYNVPVILAGCVKPEKTGYSSSWLLLEGSKQESFNINGLNIENILARAMHETAARVTEEVITVPRETNEVTIRVTNVNGLEQYKELEQYLRSFDPIKRVELSNVDSAGLELVVEVAGGRDGLAKVLNAQYKLTPSVDAGAGELEYRWVAAT